MGCGLSWFSGRIEVAVSALAVFFFSSRRRHTRWTGDWSSDVCSSDLEAAAAGVHTSVGSKQSFPIAGVGASAGGLEAFTALLTHLPSDPGMAFVLIQHLDPNQPSQLTDRKSVV